VCVLGVFTDVYQSEMITYVWDRPSPSKRRNLDLNPGRFQKNIIMNNVIVLSGLVEFVIFVFWNFYLQIFTKIYITLFATKLFILWYRDGRIMILIDLDHQTFYRVQFLFIDFSFQFHCPDWLVPITWVC